MPTEALLEKLMEIERAIEDGSYSEARAKCNEAQQCALQIEQESVDSMTDHRELQCLVERIESLLAAPLSR